MVILQSPIIHHPSQHIYRIFVSGFQWYLYCFFYKDISIEMAHTFLKSIRPKVYLIKIFR